MSPVSIPVKASGTGAATNGVVEAAVTSGVGEGGVGVDVAPATETPAVVVVVGATGVAVGAGVVTVVVVACALVAVVVVAGGLVVVVVVEHGGFVVVVVDHAPAAPLGSSAAITPATRTFVIRFMSSPFALSRPTPVCAHQKIDTFHNGTSTCRHCGAAAAARTEE